MYYNLLIAQNFAKFHALLILYIYTSGTVNGVGYTKKNIVWYHVLARLGTIQGSSLEEQNCNCATQISPISLQNQNDYFTWNHNPDLKKKNHIGQQIQKPSLFFVKVYKTLKQN